MGTQIVLKIERGDGTDAMHCGICEWCKPNYTESAVACWRFPFATAVGCKTEALPYEVLECDCAGPLRTDNCLQGEWDGLCCECKSRIEQEER